MSEQANDQMPVTSFVDAAHKCSELEERCVAVVNKCRENRAVNQGLDAELDKRIDAAEAEALSILQEINSLFFKDLVDVAATAH